MDTKELLNLMKARKSSGVLFDENRPIAPEVLRDILEAATWAPTAHNMQNFEIVAVNDKATLLKLSELKSAVSPVFLQENYPQLSFSEAELRQRKTGLLAAVFPPEWLSEEAQAGKLAPPPMGMGELISRGPVLLIVLYDPNRRAPASEGDFLGVMSLGFMLENLWLMAAAHGVSAHIVSAFGEEPLSDETKKALNIPETQNIALGVRLGYPEKDNEGLRVRRDIEDFVSYNSYKK